MASDYERFWQHTSFAVVGHTASKNFPKLTYQGLKSSSKKVFAVDPSIQELDGDPVYPDLASLPEPVQAAVLEVPREETKAWVERVAEAGIKDVWIHMNRETPEAVSLARDKGLHVLTGNCAVMYVTPGFTYHSIHKWLWKLTGKY